MQVRIKHGKKYWWYKNKIGEIFTVDKILHPIYEIPVYKVRNSDEMNHYILIEDCEDIRNDKIKRLLE